MCPNLAGIISKGFIHTTFIVVMRVDSKNSENSSDHCSNCSSCDVGSRTSLRSKRCQGGNGEGFEEHLQHIQSLCKAPLRKTVQKRCNAIKQSVI